MLRRGLPALRLVRLQSTARTSVAPSLTNLPFQKAVNSKNEESPLPINVKAVYYAPLKLPIQYGDLVADLQLRSYDNENLDFYADFNLRVGFYLGMPMTGPKPLPSRRERWTVIKSPFAQAKSKENFERHTHKRLIRVWDTNPEVVQIWLSYISKHAITGVGIKCNVFQRSKISLDMDLNNVALLEPQSGARDETPDESKSTDIIPHTLDEAVGAKVMELLNRPEFKRHL